VGAHRISCEVVEVVEGEDPGGEEPEGLESLLVGYAERSGDALGGEAEEGLCGGRWLGEEGFGGGLEPEHALEAALGVEGSVEELGYEGMRFPRFGGHPMIEVQEVFTWHKRERRTQRSSGGGWWS
jgi:hypothetical protein